MVVHLLSYLFASQIKVTFRPIYATSEDLQGQRLDYRNLLSVSKLDLQEW